MILAMEDHELVALISTVLGIVLTLLKFFLERKNDAPRKSNRSSNSNELSKGYEPRRESGWARFKRSFIILLVGFFIGVATCFYLFVGTDWKARKAFKRFSKKQQRQPFHRHH